MRAFAFASVAAIVIATCASAAEIPATQPAIKTFPEVGAETEVEIGQPMVLRESLVQSTTLRLPEDVTSDSFGMGVRLVLKAGVYRLHHQDDKGRYYLGEPGQALQRQLGSNSQIVGGIFVPADGGSPMAYQQTPIASARVKAPDMHLEAGDRSGFRRELIYSGVAQGVVSVSYREFVRDLARPAFTQELKCDLANGNEIGFKGARIEIIKAGNATVRYKVTKPLDDAAADAGR